MYQDTSTSPDLRPPADAVPVDLAADLDTEFWDLAAEHETAGQPLVDDCV